MNPSRQHGLTLLEVLVALSIFALAAGALLKIVGEHGRHAGQLELRYFAQLAAQNHLANLHLQPAWPATGKRTRKVALAGYRFTLTEQVEGTDNPDIRRVTTRTTGDDGRLLSELQAFMGATP